MLFVQQVGTCEHICAGHYRKILIFFFSSSWALTDGTFRRFHVKYTRLRHHDRQRDGTFIRIGLKKTLCRI